MSSETRHRSVRPDDALLSYSTLLATLVAFGERFRDALVYSSAYLVVIAMVEVVTVMVALSLPPSPAPVVGGLVTFAVYAGDRLTDADTDTVSNPNQAAFARRHRRVLSVLSAASYGLAVAISVLGGPVALGITLLPGTVWILYATDWLSSAGTQFQRLKNVLVVNSAVVAGAWAVGLVFLPLAFADAPFTPTAAVVFGYFFVDTFVNTEIPNVRDREGDAAIGVRTLPVAFGVRRTRHILYGLDVGLLGFLGAAYLSDLFPFALTVGAAVGLGYALVLAAFVGRTERYGRLGIAGEAKHLLVIALVLAVTGL